LKDRLDKYKNMEGEHIVFVNKLIVLLVDEEKLSRNKKYVFKPGNMNYMIYSLMVDLMNKQGKSYTNCFHLYNDLTKFEENYLNSYNELFNQFFRTTLGLVRMEFYRMHLAPYEDEKIIENGDVT